MTLQYFSFAVFQLRGFSASPFFSFAVDAENRMTVWPDTLQVSTPRVLSWKAPGARDASMAGLWLVPNLRVCDESHALRGFQPL